MKSLVFFAAAALALVAAPVSADNGNVFDWKAHQQAYGFSWRASAPQCFNGNAIAGVSRSGEKTVYIQPKTGGIYQVALSSSCDALNAAQDLSMRAYGSDAVCVGGEAEMIARTPIGELRCHADEVRRLTPREISRLAAEARR
jgi:hypothetical protein